MPRSIGGSGLEQGGPNLGNDYSRDITREEARDDTNEVVVPHNKQPKQKHDQNKKDNKKKEEQLKEDTL
jgi:hypothetical protein